MQCEVNKTDICPLGAFHQVFAKVINGRKLLVVISFRKVAVVEDRPTITRCRFIGIIVHQPRLTQAKEEIRVDLLDLVLQQTLQEVEPPTTADITSALATGNTGGGGRISPVEQAASPRRLLLKVEQLTLFVSHSPADRSRTHVQTDVVVTFDIPQIHAHQPLPSCYSALVTRYQSG